MTVPSGNEDDDLIDHGKKIDSVQSPTKAKPREFVGINLFINQARWC